MSTVIMEHLFSLLVLCTNGMMGYIVWKLKKKDTQKDNERRALALLLRREMNELYSDYKEKDTLTSSEFNEFSEIYTVYHNLGGNGSGTHMFEKIKEKEING